MKRQVIALFITVAIVISSLGGVAAESIGKLERFQSDNAFSLSADASVRRMIYGFDSLGELTISSTIVDSYEVDGIPALVLEAGRAASMSYENIHKLVGKDIPKASWKVVEDNQKSIGAFDFGKPIKTGGILVQKSETGNDWHTVYTNTDVFSKSRSAIFNFYTPNREDLNSGCYYRIVFAYHIQKQTSDSSLLFFIDTSDYENRWIVELFTVYLVSDTEIEAISATGIADSAESNYGVPGTVGWANQSAVNQSAAIDTFNTAAGHGFAAEAANVQAHAEQGLLDGSVAEHVGADNAANGADYIIRDDNGFVTQIQCKYYANASDTVGACFENGVFRYYSDAGVPMTIEVPADQYVDALAVMRKRISAGQVPGVTNPDDAANIIRKGAVTYKQAQNIAVAGNIDSLLYDAKTGGITALSSLGISATIQFACSIWNGEPLTDALASSIYTGLYMGGNAFVTSVLSSQLTRTSLNSLLVPGSEAVIKAIGPKAAAVIVNAGRIGMAPIYGAAAMKSAARMLRGGIIVNTVSLLVFTVPDVVETFRGRISGKQLLKNVATTAGGLAGAGAGAAGGAAIGTAIFPGIGTTVGGIIGAIAGGVGASMGTDYIADLIAEDDADEMLDIVSMEYQNLAEEYLLSQAEADIVSNNLQEQIDAKLLKDMFASDDQHEFARNLIKPVIAEQISKRGKITVPSEDEITESLISTLEEIYDSGLLDDVENGDYK